ncbi:MAG: MoxR family ATPase, partial [Planctomycetota bacterium]
TYPLPEAQVDRFMLKLRIGYPTKAEERSIVDRMASSAPTQLSATNAMTLDRVASLRALVDRVHLDPRVRDYIVDLVHASRDPKEAGLDGVDRLIEFGASPRASISLAHAARAHALLRGRDYATPADVKAIAMEVLRHRVAPSYEAEAENVSADDLVAKLLDHVPAP